MKNFFRVLKTLDGASSVGYFKGCCDETTFTAEVTITSIKSNGDSAFIVALSPDGKELWRTLLDANGRTYFCCVQAKIVDFIIATEREVLSFLDLSGRNNLELYRRVISPFKIEYDDDAIAEENYYLLEENLPKFKGDSCGRFGDENAIFKDGNKGKKEESAPTDYCKIHNYDDDKKSQVKGYYKSVIKNLDGMFLRYRSTQKLTKTLPNSRFFELNSSGKTLFGVQYKNGVPLYFIYAVYGNLISGAPDKLKGKACFLPSSIFDLSGQGYWCLFQDANLGELIKNPY